MLERKTGSIALLARKRMPKNRKPIDLLNLARLIENLPTKLLKSCTRDRTVQYNAWVISDDLLGRPAFYAIFVTPRVDQQLVIGLPAHRFAECGPLLLIGAIVFLLFFFLEGLVFSSIKIQRNYKVTRQGFKALD